MVVSEGPTSTPVVSLDAPAPSREVVELSHRRLRRGVWLTAAGLTMGITGANLLAVGARTECTETGRGSPLTMGLGGMTLGIGVAMGIGGGWNLQHQPYLDPSHRARRILGSAALGIGVGMAASLLPMFFGVMESAFCSDY
jgi:hypothetical protein